MKQSFRFNYIALVVLVCFLAIPFSGIYQSYKVSRFGEVKYVTFKELKGHVKGGRYARIEYELIIEEGDVEFEYSPHEMSDFNSGDRLPIHFYKNEQNDVLYEIYTGNLDSSFLNLYFSSASLWIIIPSILIVILILLFFVLAYAEIIVSTFKLLKRKPQKLEGEELQEIGNEIMLENKVTFLNYLQAFFPILIGFLLSALITKAIIINIEKTESHGAFLIGLYLLLSFGLMLLTPYLIHLGIRKYHHGNHKILRIVRTSIVAIGMLNVIIVIIQALFDNDPNNFSLKGLYYLLIENYESILG